MKKILSTFFIFCLLSAGFYFFDDLFLGVMSTLKLPGGMLNFLWNHQVIVALLLGIIVTLFGVFKEWRPDKSICIANLLLRYFLGLSILTYGLTKILQTQFVVLPFSTWQEPLEKLHGTTIAWAFLGYSSWFEILLGFLEFIPATLLFFRRTAFLGTILLLPMTLNVCLINYALDLWNGTKILSSEYLGVNILLLLLEWKRIVNIANIILGKAKSLKYFGWEVLVFLFLTTVTLYPWAKIFWNYRSKKDFLTGDWFHKHPNEWSLQSEVYSDSVISNHRILKLYFGPQNRYGEVTDTGRVVNGNNFYEIDEKMRAIILSDDNGGTTRLTYKLLNDSTLEIVRFIDSLKNTTLTQTYKRRVINKNTIP